MSIAVAMIIAALFGCGTFLLLQRQLTRIVIGLAFLAHGANLLIVFSRSGPRHPSFIRTASEDTMLDPLPQAFVLTAIVIAFGTTALLLALAYRSWIITHDDEVEDDVEDRLVQLRKVAKEVDALAAAVSEDFENLEDQRQDPNGADDDRETEPVPATGGVEDHEASDPTEAGK